MSSRDEIIAFIQDSRLLETCVDYQLLKFQGNHQNKEDIIQDAWLWLLTYDEAKLNDAYEHKHLNALITRYLQNQINSTTSEYWRRYRRAQVTSDEISQKLINTLEDS